LFYRFLSALQSYTSEPATMCVGDDWQAINGFAGSVLDYFTDFTAHFPNASVEELTTNYRSDETIVENANALMKGLGSPAVGIKCFIDRKIEVVDVTQTRIERRESSEHAAAREFDTRFNFQRIVNGKEWYDPQDRLKSQYLKSCYQIITNNPEAKIAILSRRNSLYFTKLSDFLGKLKSCFNATERKTVFKEDKIKIGSIHSFKGLEADIVIILEICDGAIPLIHPDNSLFEPLGLTPDKVMEEERRLFYVAITRPYEKLYLLTEQGHYSPFMHELNLPFDHPT